MSSGMLSDLIVRHCSPTLAGMKTGSLFACDHASGEDVCEITRQLNRSLTKKGLRVLPVRVSGNRVLVYVYRPKRLREDFSGAAARSILEEYGYAADDADKCVVRLIGRLRTEDAFPHEIGLFLGYPPEDVRGFIIHGGGCSKCTGCWKVYGDRQSAEKLFAKYRKCTDIYCALWQCGRSLERLTVTI